MVTSFPSAVLIVTPSAIDGRDGAVDREAAAARGSPGHRPEAAGAGREAARRAGPVAEVAVAEDVAVAGRRGGAGAVVRPTAKATPPTATASAPTRRTLSQVPLRERRAAGATTTGAVATGATGATGAPPTGVPGVTGAAETGAPLGGLAVQTGAAGATGVAGVGVGVTVVSSGSTGAWSSSGPFGGHS